MIIQLISGTKCIISREILRAADEAAHLGERFSYEGRGYAIEIEPSDEVIDGEPEFADAVDLILDGVDFIYDK